LLGFIGVILVLIGLLMIYNPTLVWTVTEKWKSQDATEPSDLYVLSLRIGGVLATLAGLAGIVAFRGLEFGGTYRSLSPAERSSAFFFVLSPHNL